MRMNKLKLETWAAMRNRLALNLCLAIIFLALRSSSSATAVLLRRPQFSVGFLFQRTVAVNQRPCSCPDAYSCSCCQSVTILLRGVVRNFCVNFSYQQTGLSMRISLGPNLIRQISIIDYSTYRVCTAIPDCPFSSACVEVLELSKFPRSITICIQLDVTSKIENWLINYNCISISTVLTDQSNTGATTIVPPTTTNIVLNGTTGMNGMQPGQMQPGQMQPGQMQPGQMQPGQMQPGQMQPGQMQPGQMQPGQMQPGQMQPGQMQPGQMQPGQMQPGQMQPGQMQPGQMQPGQMLPGQMQPGQMQPGQMLPGQMQPGQMQPGQMQPGQMQPGQMQPGQMQPGQMQPGQMQPGQMQPGQMQPGQMQPGQMQPGQMQPGQMLPGQMQPGQMQPGQIQPGQMQPGQMQPGQMLPGQMQPGQMQPGQMQPGQMQPGQMQPGQMQPGQMQPGQMQPGQMQPGQMRPGQMQPGQMQPGQMQPGQMQPGQMQPGQMQPGQMQPGQMQPGQMQPGQMQPGQMQPGQMQPGQMQPGQMQPGQMQPGQMQPGQMQPGQMQPGQMQPGQMQPGQMQPGQMQPGQFPPGQMPMGQFPPRQMQGMSRVKQVLRGENLHRDQRISSGSDDKKELGSYNMNLGKVDHRTKRNVDHDKKIAAVKMQVINRRRKNGLPRMNGEPMMMCSKNSGRSSRIVNQDTISIPMSQVGLEDPVNSAIRPTNNGVYYELETPQPTSAFPPYEVSPGNVTILMDQPISPDLDIDYDNRTSSFPNRMPPSFGVVYRIGSIDGESSSLPEKSVEELVTPKLQVKLGVNSKIVEITSGNLSDGRIIFPEQ